MATTLIDDDILFSPSDDGSGQNIPDIYNPELLAAQLPTTQQALAVYERRIICISVSRLRYAAGTPQNSGAF